MIKTIAEEHGICCQSCQESVNVHGCFICKGTFDDGDEIYCKQHSRSDCEHCHVLCKPEDATSDNKNLIQEK